MGKLNYHYDEKTGEYLSNSPADVDRLKTLAAKETIYFGPPRYATQVKPPAGLGECVFNDGVWNLKAVPEKVEAEKVEPPKVEKIGPVTVDKTMKTNKKADKKTGNK